MKAKDSKRMTSTASRINRHHVASLFWTLVAVDFVILLTILLTWAYMAEKAALGDAWAANMHRRAEWTEGLSFFDTLRSVVYRFSLPEGEPFQLEAGSFLIMVARAGLACLGFEALTLVHRWRSGRQQIMRLLSPLHQMSETAQQLSQAGFDEQKFHDLEHAIEALSPTAPDAFRVTTSGVMSEHGEPDFTFLVFDQWDDPGAPFFARLEQLTSICEGVDRITVVEQFEIDEDGGREEVFRYLERCERQGYEGAMLRNPLGFYKEGRATMTPKPYDGDADFTHIAMVADTPTVMLLPPNSPFAGLAALLAGTSKD